MDPDMMRRWAEERRAHDLVVKAAKNAVPDVPEWDWRRKIVDETGSLERFYERVKIYDRNRVPRVSHHFWWFVHNVVAHPLIGIMPFKSFFEFHDWTSKKINGEK